MVKWLSRKKTVIGTVFVLCLLTAVGFSYAFSAGVGAAGTTPVKELSLKDAIDLAVKNNPDIEIADLGVKKAQSTFDGADKAAYNLSVDDAVNYQLGLIKYYNPVATEVGLKVAKKNRVFVENSLRLSVEKAYYNVLKAQRNLKIKQENLKYFQDQLKIAQTGYKIGTKAKVDVTGFESTVASFQALVTSENNTYRAAVMELNRLTGLDLDTNLKLTTGFNTDKISSSVSLDETLTKALEDSYSIYSVKQSLRTYQAGYETAQRYLGGGAAAYDAAREDYKIAEVNVRKQTQTLTSTVKQSYLSLFALEQMIDWQTKEVEKAKENARVFALKYQAGLATSLDVKKANIDLETAEEGLSESIYNYNLLKAQFKYNLF